MHELLSIEFAFIALIISECAMIDAFEKRRWANNRHSRK